MKNENRSTCAAKAAGSADGRGRRCEYLTERGRRCRSLAVSGRSGLCAAHERKKQADVTRLADQLEKCADSFHTPEGVSDVMFVLFFALVEGRITERKAGILTYMLQATLHAQRAIERKERLEEERSEEERGLPPYRLTWNLPPTATKDPEPKTKRAESECSADLQVSAAQATDEAAGIKASVTPKNPASADAATDSGSVPSVSKSDSPEEKSAGLKTGHCKEAELLRPTDLNHFFPVDPTLPAHLQDPNRVAAPPLSDAELERRKRQFDRVHGFVRRGKQSYPTRESPDWKILNGR